MVVDRMRRDFSSSSNRWPGIEGGSDAGWMEHLDLGNIQHMAFPNAILEKWPMLANNRSDQDITTPDECNDDFTWNF
jgi:hypothetical protein